ncbi:MAG: efflux RND transporter periplasmic adaptor subunit [Candidatus Kapaibacteriales bacterium]
MAKKKSKKWIIIVVLVIIAGAIGVATLGGGEEEIKVTVGESVLTDITEIVKAIGKIRPETEVEVSSEISGELVYLGVKEGDNVTKGQLLARIRPDIIESQLQQLEAATRSAKSEILVAEAEEERSKLELERIRIVYEQDFATKQQLDQAKAAYLTSQARVEASKQRYLQSQASLNEVMRNKERTTIYSPIDGVVTSLEIEIGEKILGTAQFQGTAMMTIADLSVMDAVVEIDENDIIKVSLGDTTDVEIEAFENKIFKGIVSEIGHAAIQDPVAGQDQVVNFEVKINLLELDGRLRPGMSSEVKVKTQTKYNVVGVPHSAVVSRDGLSQDSNDSVSNVSTQPATKRPDVFVFVYDDASKTVNAKKVEIGISNTVYREITDGLGSDEKIVTGPFAIVSDILQNGMKVQVADKLELGK